MIFAPCGGIRAVFNYSNTVNIDRTKEKIMKTSFRVVEMALVALIAVSPIGGVGSAWADGPNTAPHAQAPATPTPVITHTTTHTAVGQGGCQNNYTLSLIHI